MLLSTPEPVKRTNSLEWNLTYKCNLKCHQCNRVSNCLKKPHTPDMTAEDALEFMRQAREISWFPDIQLIGGEPTLHPEFRQFVDLAFKFNPGHVMVWSNNFSEETKRMLLEVKESGKAKISGTSKKGSVDHPVDGLFMAPVDFNAEVHDCQWHSKYGFCGMSMDSKGYTVCPLGGVIDSMLNLSARTTKVKNLFDPDFVKWQTRILCEHCGHGNTYTEAQRCGALMSKSWKAAVVLRS